MPDTVKITCATVPVMADATSVSFEGTEGISQLYSFDIRFSIQQTPSEDVNLANAVGASATLQVASKTIAHGIFASMELVSAVPVSGSAEYVYGYQAVLVPRIWELTLSMHSRVFTQMSIPAILEAILAGYTSLTTSDYSVPKTRADGTTFPDREFVCQYRESDFDFMSRWMEREGLYYYFDQSGTQESLVVTEVPGVLRSPPSVAYYPQKEGTFTSDKLRAFTGRRTLLPTKVQLRDYNYQNPKLDVSGNGTIAPAGHAQIFFHGVGFETQDEGNRLANVKAQSLLAQRDVYRGSGRTLDLRAGYAFEVSSDPSGASDPTYLTTQLEWFYGSQAIVDGTYHVEVTAIKKAVQFRAPQRTPWPRVEGTEHAVVDGTSDDTTYAQLDADGRYLVWFYFDENAVGQYKIQTNQLFDMNADKPKRASAPVRMLQPHGANASGAEGFHFPLRKGTEVVCTFAGGDPDRPAIAGVAPNALAPSPVTSSNNTLNVIQTGSSNRIELDDTTSKEKITVSTPANRSGGTQGAQIVLDDTTDAEKITISSPGNKIEMDDTKGQERIKISTPYEKSYIQLGYPSDGVNSIVVSTDGHVSIENDGNKVDKVIGARTSITVGAATSVAAVISSSWVGGLSVSGVLGGSIRLTVPISVDVVVGMRFGFTFGAALGAYFGGRRTAIIGEDASSLEGNRSTWVVGNTTSSVTGNTKSTVNGDNTSTVNGDSTSTVTGLYTTTLNNRSEFIRGYKLERIKGVAYKQADNEIKVLSQGNTVAKELRARATNIGFMSKMAINCADLTIFD